MKHGKLLFAFLFLLFGSFAAWAEEAVTFTPFTWVSIKSCNALMADLKQLGEMAKDPMLYNATEQMIQSWLGEDVFAKLNKDAPIFVAMDQNMEVALFVPFGDGEVLAKFLTEKLSDASLETSEDGILQFSDSETFPDFCVKVANGWAYFATSLSLLKALPEKPEDCFGKTTETVALTLRLETLPEGVREMLMGNDGLSEAELDAENERFNEMSADEQEAFLEEAENAEVLRKQVVKFLTACRSVLLGTSLKSDTKTLELLLDCVFKPDSALASEMKKGGSISKEFAGFAAQESLLCGQGSEFLDEESKKSIQKAMKKWEKDSQGEEKASTRQFIAILDEYLTALMKQEVLQSGVALQCDAEKKNLVVGLSNSEPQALDAAFRKLVELAAKELGDKFNPEWVKYEVEAVAGVKFHTWTVPAEELAKLAVLLGDDVVDKAVDEEEITEAANFLKTHVGDSLQVAVGFGSGKNLVGIGTSPLEQMKACLAPAEVKLPADSNVQRMGYMEISVKELLHLVQQFEQIRIDELEKKQDTPPVRRELKFKFQEAEDDEDDTDEEYDAIVVEEDPATQLREAKKDLRMVQLMQKIVGEDAGKIVITTDLVEGKLTYKVTCETGVTKLLGSLRKIFVLMAM